MYRPACRGAGRPERESTFKNADQTMHKNVPRLQRHQDMFKRRQGSPRRCRWNKDPKATGTWVKLQCEVHPGCALTVIYRQRPAVRPVSKAERLVREKDGPGRARYTIEAGRRSWAPDRRGHRRGTASLRTRSSPSVAGESFAVRGGGTGGRVRKVRFCLFFPVHATDWGVNRLSGRATAIQPISGHARSPGGLVETQQQEVGLLPRLACANGQPSADERTASQFEHTPNRMVTPSWGDGRWECARSAYEHTPPLRTGLLGG